MQLRKFQGLTIRIENPRGSVRSGVDSATKKPWRTEMQYDYGEIIGSRGMDGDPVDVYLGPNRGAKFAFIVHQKNPRTDELDEDKCFLGFHDSAEVKRIYDAHYDMPDEYYGDIDAVPMDEFKRRVIQKDGKMIAAMSKIEAATRMRTPIQVQGPCNCTLKVGDPVTVDGMHGRGVVTARSGRRLTVKFRSGEYLSRDQRYVHPIRSDYQNQYTSLAMRGIKAPSMLGGEVNVEMERGPLERPKNGYIVKQGALFCVKSRNELDQNFGCLDRKSVV
jgi:hypothetical protein